VATLVGGNGEVVSDGRTGYLVPPRQSETLGDAMLRLMDLPEHERRSMGERGREQVSSRYGLHRMVDRWEEMYREVLTRKGLQLAPTLSS
jgi:glycosyltransferase involved in cell wall biosynthesis